MPTEHGLISNHTVGKMLLFAIAENVLLQLADLIGTIMTHVGNVQPPKNVFSKQGSLLAGNEYGLKQVP